MAANPNEAFVAPLIDQLAHRDVRVAARRALVAIGTPALEDLGRALADLRLPFGIRRHLPRAIGDFRGPQAATILLGQLLDEPSGMVRYRVLRELNRIRERDTTIPLDESILSEATRKSLRAAYILLDWRLILTRGAQADASRRTPGHELLVTLLADKETNTLERLVRLLGLWYPHEDFGEIYRGLRSANRADAANSLELIENLIPTPALRDAVVALVAGLARDMPDSERLASSGRYYEPCGFGYEELLAHILRQPSDSIQAIAAYHVAELGLVSLREGLETIAPPNDSFVTEVLARALERLSELDESPSAPLAVGESDARGEP
jgi:hypothetical protein